MPNKGRSLKQVVLLPCGPKRAYDLLMVGRLHAAFTGDKASISTKKDGLCSAYDGYIEARNVELVPGKKIVQAWRTSEWPEGWWSTATWTFALAREGTRMTFVQTRIPTDKFESIKSGWIEHYWDKMKAYLAKSA